MLKKENPQICLSTRFQIILVMRQYRSSEILIDREGSYFPSSAHIIQKTFIPVEVRVEEWFSVKGEFASTGGVWQCLENICLSQLGRYYYNLMGENQEFC